MIFTTLSPACRIIRDCLIRSNLKVSSGYYRLAGTSMACPHVSGAAALLLSKDPTLTNSNVANTLRVSSDDVGESGKEIYSGWGRLNAYKALLQEPVPLIYFTKITPKAIKVNSVGEVFNFSITITNSWVPTDNVTVELSIGWPAFYG